jgi:hypothetical protein
MINSDGDYVLFPVSSRFTLKVRKEPAVDVEIVLL